jgi:hypothetical protein
MLDRARGVRERIEAYGLVDCLRAKRGQERLAGCLCTLEPCTPLFASRSLIEGDRLVRCQALEPEMWNDHSDHAP